MKLKREISNEEMVSIFLKAEIGSGRFGERIKKVLKKDKKSDKIVTKPDLKNKSENNYRKKLLGKARGYGFNRGLFKHFPENVQWYKAVISKKELEKVKYINYSYWNRLSSRTRLPSKAIKKVKERRKIFGVTGQLYFDILSDIKKGCKMVLMIFVAKNKKSRIVVLEGHARLTSYFLEPKHIPKEIEVIIGYSENMDKWGLY